VSATRELFPIIDTVTVWTPARGATRPRWSAERGTYRSTGGAHSGSLHCSVRLDDKTPAERAL